ncbi:hypothetical protein L195_g006101 [Trifolium pratense]|uniref:Uncharacterized protein n=1 Tax=Trifolium pratense TaxID=57577 RepID=A0A2K3P2M4_TRIPR|nr:hypothetical protein L195_g006101 [Trifolium pratense]
MTKINFSSGLGHTFGVPMSDIDRFALDLEKSLTIDDKSSTKRIEFLGSMKLPKMYVPRNPPGAESLPPGIVVSESDFYLRRLWGDPSEDLKKKPKYLVTFTVGYDQRDNIDAAVKKFSDDFTILLFHYDGRTSEWDEYEWSNNATYVRSPTLARDMTYIVFIIVVQTSTLKLAFVVEYSPPKF